MKGTDIYGKPRSKGAKITCTTCGYVWLYMGRLNSATCPSCTHKVRVSLETDKLGVTPTEEKESLIREV